MWLINGPSIINIVTDAHSIHVQPGSVALRLSFRVDLSPSDWHPSVRPRSRIRDTDRRERAAPKKGQPL